MFVLDTLDDKIKKCFKLELQAPVFKLTKAYDCHKGKAHQSNIKKTDYVLCHFPNI